MMLRRNYLFALVFFGVSAVYAEDAGKRPIDKYLEKCIDANSSTAGMVDCIGKAYSLWDKELRMVFKTHLPQPIDLNGHQR